MSEENQYAIFKLISGEEVVTEYKIDDHFYIFRKPRKVVIMPVQGGFGIKLLPWVAGNPDGVFPIPSDHVMTVSIEMTEHILAGYKKETSPLDLSATTPTSIVGV